MQLLKHINMRFLLLFIALIFFDMMAESNLYKAGSTGKKLLSAGVIIGIIFQICMAVSYYFLAKKSPMLVINTFWHMTIFTVMTLVGVFVFKNKITPVRMLGLFFAFAALGCMVISNIYGV